MTFQLINRGISVITISVTLQLKRSARNEWSRLDSWKKRLNHMILWYVYWQFYCTIIFVRHMYMYTYHIPNCWIVILYSSPFSPLLLWAEIFCNARAAWSDEIFVQWKLSAVQYLFLYANWFCNILSTVHMAYMCTCIYSTSCMCVCACVIIYLLYVLIDFFLLQQTNLSETLKTIEALEKKLRKDSQSESY